MSGDVVTAMCYVCGIITEYKIQIHYKDWKILFVTEVNNIWLKPNFKVIVMRDFWVNSLNYRVCCLLGTGSGLYIIVLIRNNYPHILLFSLFVTQGVVVKYIVALPADSMTN